MPSGDGSFNATDRLLEASPKPLGQRVPEPLHVRLIDLCDLVYRAGATHRPTKAELLGALILAAPEDPEALIAMLDTYGRADIETALVSERRGAQILKFERRTPGPRRGSAS